MLPVFHSCGAQKKKLLRMSEKIFGLQDRAKISAALRFAAGAHKGQRRDEGTRYIIHPIRVAIALLQYTDAVDANVIAAALLHDVIEDCRVTRTALNKHFGKRVGFLVFAVTRPRSPRETERAKERAKLRKLSQLRQYPREAQLIKCADILDNIRSAAEVSFFSPARKKFPRWHREFHLSVEFAGAVHPGLCREMKKALRKFDMKQMVRGVVRFGR